MINFWCVAIVLQASFCFGNDFTQKKEALERIFTKKSSLPDCVDGYIVPVEEIQTCLDSEGFPTFDALKHLIREDFFPLKSDDDMLIEDIIDPTFEHRVYALGVKDHNKNNPVFFLKITKDNRLSLSFGSNPERYYWASWVTKALS